MKISNHLRTLEWLMMKKMRLISKLLPETRKGRKKSLAEEFDENIEYHIEEN